MCFFIRSVSGEGIGWQGWGRGSANGQVGNASSLGSLTGGGLSGLTRHSCFYCRKGTLSALGNPALVLSLLLGPHLSPDRAAFPDLLPFPHMQWGQVRGPLPTQGALPTQASRSSLFPQFSASSARCSGSTPTAGPCPHLRPLLCLELEVHHLI